MDSLVMVSRVRRAAAPTYVGSDRRVPTQRRLSVGVALYAASAALLGSLGVSVFLIRAEPGIAADRLVISIVLATAGAAIAVVGAVLCIARFLLIRERVSLASGVILLLIGAGWLLPARVGPMLRLEWREAFGGFALGSAAMSAAVVASIIFLPNIDGRLTVARHIVWAGAGVASFGTVLVLSSPSLVESSGLTGPALGQVVAGPLLGIVASSLLILGYRRNRGLLVYIGLALMGLEAAELLAIRAVSIDDAWWLSSTIVSVTAASVALYGVIVEYREAHEAAQQRLFDTWTEQQLMTLTTERERARQEETLHDLRSGLLGVEAVALSGALRTAATEGLLSQELARLRELTLSNPGKPELMDVVAFAESIVELRLRQGEAVTLDTDEDLVIMVSAAELAEVLFNLLDNAARHAPRSPVSLTIKDRGPDVEFIVRDRGPGMTKDVLKHVFERGYTTHEDGSGLGLFISNEIIKRLGGELEASNRVGGGSRFSFRLQHSGVDSSAVTPVETDVEAEPTRRERKKAKREAAKKALPLPVEIFEEPDEEITGSSWTRDRKEAS